MKPSVLILVLPTLVSPLQAQTRHTLFNGKDLSGWTTLGTGRWSVSGGAILGRNPDRKWSHLAGDSSFGDFRLSLQFKNVRGNTGVYFRSEAGGAFGMTGMQIELFPGKDGSVMWVTANAYGWVEETFKAGDSGISRVGDWNTLEVEAKGLDFTVSLNGRTMVSRQNETRLPARGRIGLQMHDGDDNEVWFKEIVVTVPGTVPTGLVLARPPPAGGAHGNWNALGRLLVPGLSRTIPWSASPRLPPPRSESP